MSEQDRQPVTLDVEPSRSSIESPIEPAAIAPRARVVPMDDAPQHPQGKTLSVERVIVRMSPTIGKIALALSKAQGAFGEIKKTEEAEIKMKAGGQYDYEYETLADVIAATRKALSDNEIACVQFPFPGEKTLTIRTYLMHSSDEWIYNDLYVALENGIDAKSVGSAITYACRYARKAILGLSAREDDDDGTAAGRPRQEPPKPAQRVSQQQPPTQAAPPANVGTVAEIAENPNGAATIQLSTGFRCGTRATELIEAIKRHKADGTTVELLTRASSNPARYVPTLEEISVRRNA